MIRFMFQGADEQHCMAWLKELHVRSHVLVGLGRIYAEHLHELVSTTPAAKELLCRAETFAHYESNVRRLYPEEQFGGSEGGLSDVVRDTALESLKMHQERESSARSRGCERQGKNADPDDPPAESDEKIFANIRPCVLAEDLSLIHI